MTTSPTVPMTVTVEAFHNIATDAAGRNVGMLDGYKAGHPLVRVTSWRMGVTSTPEALLEVVYHRLNVGDDPGLGTPDTLAVQYRQAGNRSLSVGDVVRIREDWFSCERSGWQRIEAPAWFAFGAVVYGTTAIAADR